MRKPLQQQLMAAWTATIEEDYCSQLINSEQSLQAAFWYRIHEHLPENRRTFIEPKVHVELRRGPKKPKPDIVICNQAEVIAVIELKYTPWKLPTFSKDLFTLRMLSKHRAKLSIRNARYRGPEADDTEYVFAKNALFVWAGVHRIGRKGSYNCVPLSPVSADDPYLGNCFFRLHAETRKSKCPIIYSRFD